MLRAACLDVHCPDGEFTVLPGIEDLSDAVGLMNDLLKASDTGPNSEDAARLFVDIYSNVYASESYHSSSTANYRYDHWVAQLKRNPNRSHPGVSRRHKKSLRAQPLHDLLEEQVNDNTFAALHRFVQLRKRCHCHMFRRSMLVERYWRRIPASVTSLMSLRVTKRRMMIC